MNNFMETNVLLQNLCLPVQFPRIFEPWDSMGSNMIGRTKSPMPIAQSKRNFVPYNPFWIHSP